ncbi:hypothetical protein BKP35_08375 [Anaerobacillus arseniciselenatis]|uniref:Uncharacterized protein n=1 Tax=Anaerobacillus arseniciselenatis TaxID=85682 RepID=A0A1S2LN58_9BACI|nr:hypothetical protein BKP35_08375 [Anaerobacillus arseniciselenatis]
MKDHGGDTPTIKEIIQRSLIRAKLAELLADPLLGHNKKSASFIVGLFSLLDTKKCKRFVAGRKLVNKKVSR